MKLIDTPKFAIDPALFMSAESILHNEISQDPFAWDSLEIIVNQYCNNTSISIPLPGNEIGVAPTFLNWWGPAEKTFIPGLEFFDDIITVDLLTEHKSKILAFIELTALPVAKFIAHQFSEEMVDQHVSRGIGLSDVMRVAPVSNSAIKLGLLTKFVSQLEELYSNNELRQPARYRHHIGSKEIPTFIHLCCGYAISACLRGKKFSLGISLSQDNTVYEHHWLRNPVLRKKGTDEENRTASEVSYPRWGVLVRNAISQNVISKDPSEIENFVRNLRSNVPQDILKFSQNERSEMLVDLVASLKISPPYKKVGLQRLTKNLVKNADDSGFFASTILDVVNVLAPTRWIKQKENLVRSKYFRSTYWNRYDDSLFKGVFQQKE